jgi:tRNA(Arg) A34 adenosine deaminase TadA
MTIVSLFDAAALPPAPSPAQQLRHLRRSNEVARRAMALGHHPFGALLVGPDHETVLLEQCNIDTVNHAEATLARVAATNFTPAFLWRCTLYTAVEPCCMCAGTAYWANIGRVVYGMSEALLLAQTGRHAENPTLSLPARQVFASGQKPIELIGPVEAIVAETVAMQQAFWAQR